MSLEFIVKSQKLNKRYGETIALKNVDIAIKRGSIYGLVGNNGAGKTTFLKIISGLTAADSGTFSLLGADNAAGYRSVRKRTGAIIENPGFYPKMTAKQNLEYYRIQRGIPGKETVDELLCLVGLEHAAKKKFASLSLGMKQRLAIALAVMHDPELLILDEPINGLDPIGIAEVRAFIRALCDERGKTILISSHILSEIALLADDIGIIDKGVLLEEESLGELEAKSSRYIRLTVSDSDKAVKILEHQFHEYRYAVQDVHGLQIYNPDLSVGRIVTAFVKDGLEVSEAFIHEESLEDYFKRVTGGEGIA